MTFLATAAAPLNPRLVYMEVVGCIPMLKSDDEVLKSSAKYAVGQPIQQILAITLKVPSQRPYHYLIKTLKVNVDIMFILFLLC